MIREVNIVNWKWTLFEQSDREPKGAKGNRGQHLQWTVTVVTALIGAVDAEFSPVHLYIAPLSLGSTWNSVTGKPNIIK